MDHTTNAPPSHYKNVAGYFEMRSGYTGSGSNVGIVGTAGMFYDGNTNTIVLGEPAKALKKKCRRVATPEHYTTLMPMVVGKSIIMMPQSHTRTTWKEVCE